MTDSSVDPYGIKRTCQHIFVGLSMFWGWVSGGGGGVGCGGGMRLTHLYSTQKA